MAMTPETRRKIEQQLEQVEERKRQQMRRANAQAARLRARLAKEDRAARNHHLIELGAGLEAMTGHATDDLFVGGKEQDLRDRELNQRVWNRGIDMANGQTMTLAQIYGTLVRQELDRRARLQQQRQEPPTDPYRQ